MDGRQILTQLPSHVQERVREAKTGSVSNGCVIYWMRNTLRAHENPALDAAIGSANAMKLPLQVVLHLEDCYPHATARRQMFLLQGAAAVQQELYARGVHTCVQVDRKGHRPDVVQAIVQEAALIVTEEAFCAPWLAGVEALLRSSLNCPVWLVDCSSVVPSSLVPSHVCHRAYQFEQATRQLHDSRMSHTWRDAVLECKEIPTYLQKHKDSSIDLTSANLAALVSSMEVDQSVGVVDHTKGGSAEGYARWNAWVAAGGLRTYAKRRNDSLDVQGVSRMSAYLNSGMVSPMRLAKDVKGASGSGKGKFLNEFLTWRGLTYAWCFHFPMPASGVTSAQLPAWAQESLAKHSRDQRNVIPLEQLAAGLSNDKAWNSMQQYLVQTGELHNNARMGWGCAICKWTASPEQALQALVHLNNTYALDGHSPPSYGGLLGCLGLFTGPKGEQSILGKVPFRPPKAKYAAMVNLVSTLGGVVASPPSGNSCASLQEWLKFNTKANQQDRYDKRRAATGKVDGQDTEERSHRLETKELPQKRRWKNLKPPHGEMITIDID